MKKLENKVALIVAATRGIGLACAQELANNGAKVFLGVRRMDAGQEIADEIIAKGGYAKPVYFDAYKSETYESMIEDVVKETNGQLDIIVNNFGGTKPAGDTDVVNTDLDTWNDNILSNINSIFLPTKYGVPYMIKSGGGSIINITSKAAVSPDLVRVAYSTVKAAANMLTKNIATQYGHKKIRCNAIMPGMIATEAVSQNLTEEFKTSFLRHVPLGRIGEAEDIAKAVLFFASDDSSYITGQCLEVAGGMGVPTSFYADTLASMNVK